MLVVAIIAFSIVNGRFLSAANLGLVLQQVTVIATLALGQTLIILTAGIDLSAGAIAVFSSILMANMATKLGVPGVARAASSASILRHRDGRDQRPAGHPDQAAAVHRHAGHADRSSSR